MTLSDALPVQFWLNGEETYNEKIVDGAHRFCFCSPWKCTDEIKLQFEDSSGSEYTLAVLNTDSQIIKELQFDRSGNIYSTTLNPNVSPEICDEEVSLEIQTTTQLLSDHNFLNGSWVNRGGGGVDWTESGGFASSTLTNVSQNVTKIFTLSAAFENKTYSIDWIFEVTSKTGTSSLSFRVHALDAGDNIISTTTVQGLISSTGVYTGTSNIDFTGASKIGISAIATGTTFTWAFRSDYIKVFDDTSTVAFSDCLSVRNEQKETILIEYSNHRDFADLSNLNVSPDPTYYLRIPATFFKQRFPQESEVIELSNSRSVQLNAQVKAQKLLSIGPMPPYMHRKVILALSHQFVTIDGKDWVKQETYELVDSSRNSPLNQARIWLTEKDYIKRNIL